MNTITRRKITRVTPCAVCKRKIASASETGTGYIWCGGCGEWEIVNNKGFRPAGWTGWI